LRLIFRLGIPVNETLSYHSPEHESERATAARSRAAQRHLRRRARLRPLGWAVLAVVIVSAVSGHPAPGLTGTHLGVSLALAAYAIALLLELRPEWPQHSLPASAAATALLGSAGVALAALQPHGPVEIAPSVAVWLAATRLPRSTALPLAAAITVGLDLTIVLTSTHWDQSIAAATLLRVLMFVTAEFMRRANESQEQTEELLAELEDARDAQARAAALAERGRIARDLHDVLAHSLSALTIQLEGARLLAAREQSGSELAAAITRAGQLARNGLTDAKRAVGALRGDAVPSASDLPGLAQSFCELGLDATLEIVGQTRPLPDETWSALYRAAQEALTNALRYAPSSQTTVTLHYQDNRVLLTVEDNGPDPTSRSEPLAGVGGGRGLTGMRERIEALGGSMTAGPAGNGFRVEVEAPA
jgi:signal transduction histidine kinase